MSVTGRAAATTSAAVRCSGSSGTSTVKQAVWKFHERVNIRGERIARAKQALPNGYSGLPLVQSCPHPNACLSCPSFLTDASFRGVHEQQRVETERLLGTAREADSVRLVELLQRDHASLTRILEGLDAIEVGHAAAEIDLRGLTSAEREEQAA